MVYKTLRNATQFNKKCTTLYKTIQTCTKLHKTSQTFSKLYKTLQKHFFESLHKYTTFTKKELTNILQHFFQTQVQDLIKVSSKKQFGRKENPIWRKYVLEDEYFRS